jgi:hypothetical protein
VLLKGRRELFIDQAVDELEPKSDRTLISHVVRLPVPTTENEGHFALKSPEHLLTCPKW